MPFTIGSSITGQSIGLAFRSKASGKINHANLFDVTRPHLEIRESATPTDRGLRRDVTWITDRGELHEWYLGEWRQEYLVKSPEDYRVLQRAFEDAAFTANPCYFEAAEGEVGQGGMTVGQMGRTPLMELQIDRAGLARFSMDLADQRPELMELLELMNAQLLDAAGKPSARPPDTSNSGKISRWKRSAAAIIAGIWFRNIVNCWISFRAASKRMLVHYDGKLRLIAEDIAALGICNSTP